MGEQTATRIRARPAPPGTGTVRLARHFIICLVFLAAISARTEARASEGFYGLLPQQEMSPADLATVKAGGIQTIRLPISRQATDMDPERYDWKRFDRAIGDAATAGLTVLPTIYDTALWENSDYRWVPNTAAGLDRWREKLRILVGRYGSEGSFWRTHPSIPKTPVTTWQIWNEVNTRWFSPSVSPSDYAHLVIESANVIRAEDPGAEIMLAGMYATPQPGDGMHASEYLKRLYKVDGFRGSFDYAAIHPYEATVSAAIGDIVKYRQVMDNWGDEAKGIYVTEMGWGSDSRTAFGTGSTGDQALALTSAYSSILLRPSLKVLGIYWFTWKDVPAGQRTCVFCYRNGLFDVNRAPKPAWWALTKVIEDGPQAASKSKAKDPTHPSTTPAIRPSGTARPTSRWAGCRRFRGRARRACRKMTNCKRIRRGKKRTRCWRMRAKRIRCLKLKGKRSRKCLKRVRLKARPRPSRGTRKPRLHDKRPPLVDGLFESGSSAIRSSNLLSRRSPG